MTASLQSRFQDRAEAGRQPGGALDHYRERAPLVLSDEAVILETPVLFRVVARVYEHWHDVSEGEVSAILKKWHQEG